MQTPDLTTAIQTFVSHLSLTGREELASALRDAASEEFDWIWETQDEGALSRSAYHYKRWADLTDAASYVEGLLPRTVA